MARRRRTKEAPIAILLKTPWWISIVIGVTVLVALKWMLPAIWASNVFLKPLVTMLSGMAWSFSGVFFIVGMVSLTREKWSASRSSSRFARKPATPSSLPANGRERQAQAEYFATQNSPVNARDRLPETREPPIADDSTKAKPTVWSIELLHDLEWKRFEDVCQQFYALKGIKSETTPLGPDGGIDIRLFQDESGKLTSLVQCKAWGARRVGIKPIRELLGVMAHEKIEKAFFMTSGGFTDEAKQFAQTNRIILITGEMLLAMIQRLPDTDRQALLTFAIKGDYRTPTCSSCGIKMRRVPGTNGRTGFWGCQNYPRCRQKIGIRATDRR